MKRTLVCVLVLTLCPTLCSVAWASWGSFTSTGTATGIGAPSCAEVSANHVVCAVRSGMSTVMVNGFNGTTWGAWTSLPGTVESDPSCTSDGAGKVICAAAATNGKLQVSIFNGTSWSTPTQVSASLYSAPGCAQYTTGQVVCAARNVAGGLAWSRYNGTTWTAFANLSPTGGAVSAPSCTTDNNSGVVCSVFVKGFGTQVNRYAAGKWEGFLSIGGIAGGEPDCTSLDSGGQVVCFAKAYSSGIYVNLFNGAAWAVGSWSGYRGLGGGVNDNASCTSQNAGQLVCGVNAYDNIFYANVFTGASWSGWIRVGGTGVGSPACAPLGTGKVVCVVMGINNRLTSVVGP